MGYSPCDCKKDMTEQLNTHSYFLHTIKEIPLLTYLPLVYFILALFLLA